MRIDKGEQADQPYSINTRSGDFVERPNQREFLAKHCQFLLISQTDDHAQQSYCHIPVSAPRVTVKFCAVFTQHSLD